MNAHVVDIVASLGVRMRIVSDGPIASDPRFATLIGAYVPGAKIARGDGRPSAVLVHGESSARQAFVSRGKVTIADAWNGKVGDDAYHLLHAMARSRWLDRGVYSAHSACVETATGECVLLVGPSGSGKTTVMLEMLRSAGCRMISGNKTLLEFREDSMFVVGGTSTVTLSSADLPSVPFTLNGKVEYGDRVAGVLADDLVAPPGKAVTRVVFPMLRRGEPTAARIDPLRALHMLHPTCLDAMNADVVLAGGAGTYLDGCPKEARRALAPNLARVLGSMTVVEASGCASSVADAGLL
jgi:hypothetical protein